MKLGKDVFNVLKNYATINQGITVNKGNKLETISLDQSVYSVFEQLPPSDVSEQLMSAFPHEFSIYDLNGFLSVVSLFDEPEFTFENSHVVIGQGNEKVIYYYSEPSIIDSPPDEINFPEVDCQFFLGSEKLSKLLKAASVLGSNRIRFECDGDSKVIATVFDVERATDNTFSLDVDQFAGENFEACFKIEKLKVLGGSYTIGIKSGSFMCMSSEKINIKYYIMFDDDLQ